MLLMLDLQISAPVQKSQIIHVWVRHLPLLCEADLATSVFNQRSQLRLHEAPEPEAAAEDPSEPPPDAPNVKGKQQIWPISHDFSCATTKVRQGPAGLLPVLPPRLSVPIR